MPIMEPLAFARMLNSLQEGIPDPGETETDIVYARSVASRVVNAFSMIRGDEDISETAQAVCIITQPLLEDLREAQARLDRTSVVLGVIARQMQITAFECGVTSPEPRAT